MHQHHSIYDLRDNLNAIADLYQHLKNNLDQKRANHHQGLKGKRPNSPAPLNLDISDALHQTHKDACWWASEVLAKETNWRFPPDPTTPNILRTMTQPTALQHLHNHPDQGIQEAIHTFARQHRQKLHNLANPPTPKTYTGACPTCRADLHTNPEQKHIKCPGCGTRWDKTIIQNQASQALQTRLMTLKELRTALQIAGHTITYEALKKWAQRGRIQATPNGLYRFADALQLATNQPTRRNKT